MAHNLSRREFIKLGSALSALHFFPTIFKQPDKTPDPNAPNILIILFDTLSALHLSLYGYPRQTDSHFKRFAEHATVYHNHYAGGIFTTSGTASLLTGVYPFTHRAINILDKTIPEFDNKNIFSAFKDYYRVGYTHNSLSDILLSQYGESINLHKRREELFFTNNFITNNLFQEDTDIAFLSWSRAFNENEEGYNNSLFLSKLNKFINARRVEAKAVDFPRGVPITQGDYYILENATDWISAQITDLPQPFLGYFHFIPPHSPYRTRKDFLGNFKDDGYFPIKKPEHYLSQGYSYEDNLNQRKNYDEFILYVDSEFGRLIDNLEQSGILDNTWVIFTSDHGEMFERGIWEHTVPAIYQSVIRVPLLISAPGQQTRLDITQPTSAVDILPTLLHLTGKPDPDWVEGTVLPPYRETDLAQDRNIYALDAKKNDPLAPIYRFTAMLVEWPYKLMQYTHYNQTPGTDYFELFNLEEDPEELTNLYSPDDSYANSLIEKLQTRLEKADDPYR